MYAKDFRKKAWNALSGKWGVFALITLIFTLIVGVSAYTFVGSLVFTGPLTLGLIICAMNVIRAKDLDIVHLFDGFKNFLKAMCLYIVNNILVFLWSLLLVIPGIIMSFAYSMSFYILADNPDMTITEARKASIEMMRGNKWRLFCLQFSFIGWLLLTGLTFGILAFWVMPYQQTAIAAFYEDLKAKNAPATPVDEFNDGTVEIA